MKWISFLLVFVLTSGVFSQPGTKTIKSYLKGGVHLIKKSFLIGDGADGVDTTAAFYLGSIEGAITGYFITDTTGVTVVGGNQSDSCMTINIQLKHQNDNAVWSDYAFKGSGTYTKLDTVARSMVNTPATVIGFYIPFGNDNEYAPNDSMRLILQIGVGDSLYISDLRFIGF